MCTRSGRPRHRHVACDGAPPRSPSREGQAARAARRRARRSRARSREHARGRRVPGRGSAGRRRSTCTRRCARSQPDLVIVDMDSPDRDTLEDMQRITSEQPRPIVMFVDESDSESIRTAVRAGVAAYVVKGASRGADPARARGGVRALRGVPGAQERARARAVDARRAQGDRARQGDPDGEARLSARRTAFQMLRKMAMNQGVRLAEVARHVLAAAEII